jgi:hypothetical protein
LPALRPVPVYAVRIDDDGDVYICESAADSPRSDVRAPR